MPQVYIFASGSAAAAVECSSTWAMRSAAYLARMTAANALITAFVYAAASSDPNSPDGELANLYAAITELNHYADPDVDIRRALRRPGRPEGGRPRLAVYFDLPAADEGTRIGGVPDCLLAPCGLRFARNDHAARCRGSNKHARGRSGSIAGRSGVVRHLRRLVPARACCFARRLQKSGLNLLKEWKADSQPADQTAMKEVISRATTDPRLRIEAVREQIEEASVRGGEGGPAEQIERWLNGLESQLTATGRHPDASAWSRAVWEQARDLIGIKPTGEQEHRSPQPHRESLRRRGEASGRNVGQRVRGSRSPAGRIPRAQARRDRRGVAETRLGLQRLGHRGGRSHAANRRESPASEKRRAGRARRLPGRSGAFSFFGGRTERGMRASSTRFAPSLASGCRKTSPTPPHASTARCGFGLKNKSAS